MSHQLINRRTMGAELADEVIAKAFEVAPLPVGVAVVGSAGELLAFRKMDGAPLVVEDIARDKAYTAIALGGMDTADLAGALESTPALFYGLTNVDRMMVFGGGVPVVVDGEVVGGVGVSGGTAEQDAAIAQEATSALEGLARTEVAR